MTRGWIYKALFHLLLILLELIQKNSFLNETFLGFYFHFLFVRFNKYTTSSKILLDEHALIWRKEREFF